MTKRKRVVPKLGMLWLNLEFLGVTIGFTCNEVLFREQVSLLTDEKEPVFNKKNGTTHIFEKTRSTIFIITVEENYADHTCPQVAGLIAHEALHVIQHIWEIIEEKKPGIETESYLVQYIVEECLNHLGYDQ